MKINLPRVLSLIVIIAPLLCFFWFNNAVYGNPYQLSGTVERALSINADGSPFLESTLVAQRQKKQNESFKIEKNALDFFQTKNLINGFYIHFLSPDRGLFSYTPIMLLGFAGLILGIKKNMKMLRLLATVIGIVILIYSLWDDPYGGWAFGSRYLIPAYALLSIFIAYLLTYLKKSNLFLLIFFVLFTYSTAINTLGAISSNRIPPKVEALGLEKQSHKEEKYTYMRDVAFLDQDILKSFVFQDYARPYLSAWEYYEIIAGLLIISGATMIVYLRIKGQEYDYDES